MFDFLMIGPHFFSSRCDVAGEFSGRGGCGIDALVFQLLTHVLTPDSATVGTCSACLAPVTAIARTLPARALASANHICTLH